MDNHNNLHLPSLQEIGVKEFLSLKNIMLIDIRKPEDYATSHLSCSINIPLAEWTPETILKLQKDKPVYIICYRGMSSRKLGIMLINNGFKHVFNIIGGMEAYHQYIQTK